MDNFTYFQICNHRIKNPQDAGTPLTMNVLSGPSLIDIVINGAILLEIDEVRAIQYDPNDAPIIPFFYDNNQRTQSYDDVTPGQSYYDADDNFIVDYSTFFHNGETISDPLPASFYEPILHNRIQWNVKPPIQYQVTGKVRFTENSYTNYTATSCPLCNGKGWFIDILSKDGTFSTPTGIYKIAQRVVKDLLTRIHTQMFDFNYGTTIESDITASTDDNILFTTIRLRVSEVEDGYLTNQQAVASTLAPDETLKSLTVDSIARSAADPRKLILRLLITTLSSQEVLQLTV